MKRGSGVLLHISSLPSEYMIGQLDSNAYDFVDFLHETGVTYWQILPLTTTSYGDSPYQSYSAFALNEYFISIEKLYEEGLLTKEERDNEKIESDRVDYSYLYSTRFKVLRKAFEKFDCNKEEFQDFCEDKNVFDYAMFRAVKNKFGDIELSKWDKGYKMYDMKTTDDFISEHEDEINFWCFCQYKFMEQWRQLKKYANDKGVYIIGDMPIYVSADSVEVWRDKEMFLLDKNLRPKLVAGVPPDAFTEDGQLWGNPIYNFKRMKKQGFLWWVQRIASSMALYDVLRIDHFRGFSSYYAINSKRPNAKIGKWKNAPGYKLFDCVKKHLGDVEIIGEDLGYIDEKARRFFDYVGYPGMKILQFAFDGNEDNEHLPQNSTQNYVVYTGTHDTMTTKQYIQSLDKQQLETYIKSLEESAKKMNVDCNIDEKRMDEKQIDEKHIDTLIDTLIELAFSAPCIAAIIPMQDLLYEDASCRMNYPSTLSTDNWSYRVRKNYKSKILSDKITKLNKKYCR